MVALTHLAYNMGTLEGARSKDASTQGAISTLSMIGNIKDEAGLERSQVQGC